ncbi:phenylalanine--tRNA ligase beta subunit-related protein [Candidatus Karelsulcia muelleri]|uniref:phenylalanine--tRNA ligase subunit beta-related protein n=1 Tax=Candidatus Karelsulcia muelleri TaxID=336810 RepID=UPI00236436E8|nr:phenylalanine--tRNA ligase beta subunit-related protein [Candidatus Karelsulcia muelleri]WDE42285.1 phenylalanine--tRNA ligase beta subunit-related protein [Candidatus Karelsulcia muelleri]WDR79134.1 phenylalanine--tRNA ligase beta subunit-related protein [Candidatus Karelsulcia muelleri]
MKISFKYLKKFLYNKPKINRIILFISKLGVEVAKVSEVFYKLKDKRTIIDYIINIKLPQNKYYLMNPYRLGKELNLKLTLNKFRIVNKKNLLNASYRVLRIYPVLLKNLKIVSSPVWLKIYLNSLGYQTVNSLIDLMSFFQHEFGVNFLILDGDKCDNFLKSNMEILDVKQFIKIKLNNKRIMINNTNVLFSNRSVPVSIFGIFNKKQFILNKRTKRIILLAYIFSPRKLYNLYEFYNNKNFNFQHNDFNSNFYNKVSNPDPFFIKQIIIYARKLIKRLNHCKIYHYDKIKLSVNLNVCLKKTIISLRLYNLYQRIGVRISSRKIEYILFCLEFKIVNFENNCLKFLVPLYRTDLNIEADLIGEILRIYGSDTIYLKNDMKYESNRTSDRNHYNTYIEKRIYHFLISNGYNEVINISLIDNPKDNLKYKNTVKIINTNNKNLTCLRYTILFGLLQNLFYNLNRNIFFKINDIKLFELGKIYRKTKGEKEIKKLGFISYKKEKYTNNNNNLFLIKGLTEKILRIYGLKLTKQKSYLSKDFFADRSLNIFYKNKKICKLGKINTNFLNNFQIKGQVFYSEINLSRLEKYSQNKDIVYKKISKFPCVSRDISLIINAEFCFNDIKSIIKREYRKIIKDIILLEEYLKKKETKNVIYYTIRIVFQHLKKTFTAKLVNLQVYNIKEQIKQKFKAVIR